MVGEVFTGLGGGGAVLLLDWEEDESCLFAEGGGVPGEVGLEGSFEDIRLKAFFMLMPIREVRPSSGDLGGGEKYL